jgi:hypothetical protein
MDTLAIALNPSVRVGDLMRIPGGNPGYGPRADPEHPAASDDSRRDWFAKKGRALYHELPA